MFFPSKNSWWQRKCYPQFSKPKCRPLQETRYCFLPRSYIICSCWYHWIILAQGQVQHFRHTTKQIPYTEFRIRYSYIYFYLDFNIQNKNRYNKSLMEDWLIYDWFYIYDHLITDFHRRFERSSFISDCYIFVMSS